jgi:hypothetical protein
VIIFRISIIAAWVFVAYLTANAIAHTGLAGMQIFTADLGEPWRFQFDIDFACHMLLIWAWFWFREPSRLVSLLCMIAAFAFGSLFTLLYVLAATFTAKGDVRVLLLGPRRAAS